MSSTLTPVGVECGQELSRNLAGCSTQEARSWVSESCALHFGMLPLGMHTTRYGERVLSAVFSGSEKPQLLREASALLGVEIEAEFVSESVVKRAISGAYRGSADSLCEAIQKANTTESETAIPLLLKRLLDRALQLSSSDLHLEPCGQHYRLRYRVDGLLRTEPGAELSLYAAQQLVRHTKVICKIDLTECRKPQDGGFSHDFADSSARVRFSSLPGVNGATVVYRLLGGESFLCAGGAGVDSFGLLGLGESQRRILQAHLGADSGAILLVGPTGSGKSTLLYSCLRFLNEEWRNIISLEDPVERLIDGISQVEVSRERKESFAELLPVLLRQDPDVIMVGEMRDTQTAKTALEAGLTGHVVLSTLHCRNTIEAFGRLFELGCSTTLLANTLRLVVSQRLIAKNCSQCAHSTLASDTMRSLFSLRPNTVFMESAGCENCMQIGTQGRLAVFEFLSIGKRLTALLGEAGQNGNAVSTEQIRTAATSDGYQPLFLEVRRALLSGKISPRSAMRALGLSPEFANAKGLK